MALLHIVLISVIGALFQLCEWDKEGYGGMWQLHEKRVISVSEWVISLL